MTDRRDDASGRFPLEAEREFYCHVFSRGRWAVLALGGELDIANIGQARTALLTLELARGGWLAIDLSGVSYLDSSGIRLILQAMQSLERHGGTLALIRGPVTVQRVLEVVGLADQVLTVDDLEDLD